MKVMHTSGDWATKIFDDAQTLVLANGKYLVATCTSVDRDADAQLIAAAPELLEACRAAAKELHHATCRDNIQHTHCLRCRALAQVCAAIAKAEGGG